MHLRRMDYVHINGEGELIERPNGSLVDYSSYAKLEAALSLVTPEKFAAQVILNVCELPDYTSPDDQPDLLQCTISELEACVVRAFEHFDSSGASTASGGTEHGS